MSSDATIARWFGFIGSFLICIGPQFVIFFVLISRHPLIIILHILGIFCWLLAGLVASAPFIPAGDNAWSSMLSAVLYSILMESLRYLLYLVIVKTFLKLKQMNAVQVVIEGRSAVENVIVLGFAIGAGFGTAVGLFTWFGMWSTLLSTSPDEMFMYSPDLILQLQNSLVAMIFGFHHIVWGVLGFVFYKNRATIFIIGLAFIHVACSMLTSLNWLESGWVAWYVVGMQALILVAEILYALIYIDGVKPKELISYFKAKSKFYNDIAIKEQ